jgi:ribonuclease R
VEALRAYLKAMGIGMTIGDMPKPGEFQMIAAATKDRPDAAQIHSMLLRSMQQAIYTPINSGHFGLAYEAYTHFTSPIRRYPDLLVHRVIKAILNQQKYQLPALPLPGEAHAKLAKRLQKNKSGVQIEPAASQVKMSYAEQQAWEAAGLHCSANERRADEASRDVEAWLKCKYMREHLGEEYGGVVSSVTTFGIFVTLDAMYVEGLVHITELGGEYFRFDELRQELRGERTGIRYAIGTRVQIQVSRVDLDGRKIDFRMVNDMDDLALRSIRDKGPGKVAGKSQVKATVIQGRAEAADSHRDNASASKRRQDKGRGTPSGAPAKAAVSKALYKKKMGKVRTSKR